MVIVAERLKQAVGSTSIVGRMGGDEFVVLGPSEELTAANDPSGVAHDLLDSIRQPMLINGTTIHVGASIGVATQEPGLPGGELLKRADQAMYKAKQASSGFCTWSSKPQAGLHTPETVK